MSIITKEQAKKIIDAADEVITALAGTNEDVHPDNSTKMVRLYDDLNDYYAPPEVVRELARIALASLEAEPDYYVVVTSVGVWQSFCKTRAEAEFIVSKPFNPGYSIREIYTTPPAPVSVPDEDLLHMAASAIDDLLSNKDRSGAGVWADIPAKLRRAAMLQGKE